MKIDYVVRTENSCYVFVCPLMKKSFSGAEKQAYLFSSAMQNSGFEVCNISLPNFLYFLYSKESKLCKIVSLLMFNFYFIFKTLSAVIKARKRPTFVYWGLPAATVSFVDFLFFPLRRFYTERQFSESTANRSFIYNVLPMGSWFFNSFYVANNFEKIFKKKTECSVIYNDQFLLISEKKNSHKGKFQNKRRVKFVSRVHPSKCLIEAIEYLSNYYSIAELDIYGRVESVAYKLQIEKICLIHNVCCNFLFSNVPDEIYTPDALIFHFSSNEGMPNCILEAVLFKNPVFCIDSGFLNEISFPTKYRIEPNRLNKHLKALLSDADFNIEDFNSSELAIKSKFGAYS